MHASYFIIFLKKIGPGPYLTMGLDHRQRSKQRSITFDEMCEISSSYFGEFHCVQTLPIGGNVMELGKHFCWLHLPVRWHWHINSQ